MKDVWEFDGPFWYVPSATLVNIFTIGFIYGLTSREGGTSSPPANTSEPPQTAAASIKPPSAEV